MKKDYILKLVTLSIIAFFLLISCGIPNIFVPDSSDFSSSYKVSSFDTDIFLTLSNNLANPSLNKAGFPKLALFYQIIPIGPYNAEKGFESVVSNFNSIYCDSQNGQRISYSDKNHPYHSYSYKYDSESTDFGIFQFKEDNEFINYFASANLTDSNGKFHWTLDFDYGSSENPNDGTLKLRISDPSNPEMIIDEFNLYRYNDQPFSPNLDSAYIGYEVPEILNNNNNITGYKLKVFALINTEFNDYNNVYNTKLATIGEFALN